MLAKLTSPLALAMILILLAGCSRVWQPEDIAGVWAYEAESGNATLTLDRDGALRVEGVPMDALFPPRALEPSEVDWSNLISGTGTWKLSDDGSVRLYITTESGKFLIAVVYPAGSGSDAVLESPLDASDVGWFRFARQ